MAEGPQRLASLVVVGGSLDGRRHDLEEVVTEVLIGADDSCHLQVEAPGISPIHARLWTDLDSVTAYDTKAPRGLFVNEVQVQGEAPVKGGDALWLGPPGEPDSVRVECRFERWVEVLPEAPAGVAEAPGGEPEGPPAAEDEPAPIPLVPVEDDEAMVLERPSAPDLVEAPAPVAAAPPAPAAPESPAQSSDDALFIEADPPASTGPAAGPPPSEGPIPLEEDALFVAAEPAAAATPGDDPFFVGAEARPATGTPAPLEPPAADDVWAIASPEALVDTPPPPAAEAPSPLAPVAPAEDQFFIAEEVPAEAVPPVPETRPEEVVFAEAASQAPTEAAPSPAATPPVEDLGPPDSLDGLPPPDVLNRAPLPPRQAVTQPRALSTPVGETPLEALEAPSPAPPSPLPPSPPSPDTASVPPPVSAATPAVPEVPAAAATPERPEPPAGLPPPEPAARRSPASPRPRPPGARRPPAAGARRTGRRRGRSGPPEWVRPVALGAGLAVVLGVVGLGLYTWLGRTVAVESVAPARVRVGQRAVVTGSGFSDTPAKNTVLFGGARAEVLSASSSRLEVQIPEAVVEAGAERQVPVVVRTGALESEPVEVSVFQGPRLHGLSPDVALPGEQVHLAGAGWGIGATVRFGNVPAEILEMDTTQIRVTVPALPGGYGTSAPVVVTVGGVDSNPAPFFLGRVPLVTTVTPQSASPGDVLTVTGRGFEPDPGLDDVRLGGIRALVVTATAEELRVVVPRLRASEPVQALEVRVPGLDEVGRAVVTVAAGPDPIGLRFVAEPFDGPSAHPHAFLATGLGPAFVLAASGSRSAAERALEAQQALNAAVPGLATSPGTVVEARDLETRPVLALSGRPEILLEVTPEDAAAYNEDWTRLRSRGRPVTPARLARWWEAVARDLVVMLVRGESPRFAAALAPEGRVFQQVFKAAQASGGPVVSREVAAALRGSVRDELRVAALRVPVSITAEAPAVAGAAATPPTPAPRARALQLDGDWTGSETEQGRQSYVTVTFRRDYGSIAYEGGLTLTVPFLKLERPGTNRVRFTVQMRGSIRHYHGQWDGETLSGDITRDEAGQDVVGRFELRPR